MLFHFSIWISVNPARADKSAVIGIKKSCTKGVPPWMKGVSLLLTWFRPERDFQKNLRKSPLPSGLLPLFISSLDTY
jgi:hypothetical protein